MITIVVWIFFWIEAKKTYAASTSFNILISQIDTMKRTSEHSFLKRQMKNHWLLENWIETVSSDSKARSQYRKEAAISFDVLDLMNNCYRYNYASLTSTIIGFIDWPFVRWYSRCHHQKPMFEICFEDKHTNPLH